MENFKKLRLPHPRGGDRPAQHDDPAGYDDTF